ncbi:NADP-dependent oxidoreductase domain-containing protein [Hyaloraphidium curvatum]|nr:NADP-dependent oxidoreductase domain-containing protein [Hyaloraphidium curvatum]
MASRPRVVFGTMTFGVGVGGRISDRPTINAILDLFSSRGHNEVDTARNYCGGNTEQVLGEIGASNDRRFRIATKVAPTKPGDHAPERLKAIFQRSLAALKADRVHILYLHAPDRSVPLEDTCRAMNELHREGLYEEFGVSNYAAFEVMEIFQICRNNGWVTPTVYQGMYNGITRDVEPELLPCLRKLGMKFYAYNVGAGGLLSGNYKFEEVPAEGRFDPSHTQGANYRQRYWNDTYFQAVSIVTRACAAAGITPIAAAHRWLLHHSLLSGAEGDAIIIGASSLKYAGENLDACEAGRLPEEVVAAFDEAWMVSKKICPTYHRGAAVPRHVYGKPRI